MKNDTPPSFISLFTFRTAFIFILLFIISFPLPIYILPDVAGFLAPFFETLIKYSAGSVFGIAQPYTQSLDSDSTGLYIHVFNLLIIAIAGAVVWFLVSKKTTDYMAAKYWFHTIAAYYLAYVLLTYGFSKVFKWQFYLPEPNTLYTTVGNTPPDLLFWSTMGASYSYTVFSGIVEVIPALLLFFRRTRLLGALIAFGVLVNVAVINFSFDISVKVFSCFLLLVCVALIAPHAKALARFFVTTKATAPDFYSPSFSAGSKRYVYAGLKIFIVLLLCGDVLYRYVSSGNYNDDTTARTPLYGAYSVDLFVFNNDTLPPLLTDTVYWKRVFVHREGYFIVQKMNDGMMDYELARPSGNQLQLRNYYNQQTTVLSAEQTTGTTLLLRGVFFGDTVSMHLRKMDTGKLPLLQKQFHWTIEP